MPRDPRPYVTYPIGYTQHPRLLLLSDPAFRVFHEMNDYSRDNNLDGVIHVAVAQKKWPKKALVELVTGIDDRPLVILEDRGYVLRSYAEHQFTTADIEALRVKRAEAGSAGGKAKALARRTGSKPLASATESEKQNLAESKSGSELGDLKDLGASSYVPDPASEHDDGLRFPKPLRGGGLDLNRVDAAVVKFCHRTATEVQLQAIVDAVMGRAGSGITSMTAFVVKAIENDWAEWQAFIDSGRAAA